MRAKTMSSSHGTSNVALGISDAPPLQGSNEQEEDEEKVEFEQTKLPRTSKVGMKIAYQLLSVHQPSGVELAS